MIPRDDVVAVVVDIQERLFPHIHGQNLLAENTIKLIKGLKILGVPLIVTQQYTKGLGATIPRIAEALGDFDPIEKLTFSCFGDPDFVNVLNDCLIPGHCLPPFFLFYLVSFELLLSSHLLW